MEGSPEQATTLPQREINASTPVFLPAGAEFETYAAVCRLAQDTVIRDSLLFDGRVKVNWKLEFTALSMEEDMAAQMMSFAFTQQADDYAAIVWVSKGEDAEAISRVLNRREVSVRLRRIGTRGEGTEHRLACPFDPSHANHPICSRGTAACKAPSCPGARGACTRLCLLLTRGSYRTSVPSGSLISESLASSWNLKMFLFSCELARG